MNTCKYCDDFIKWSKDYWSGKWIPLKFNCDQRHECRKQVYLCKNRRTQIYFDPNNKSPTGKLIPIEVSTHQNHTCSRRSQE
jgi:hypothetical protein